jgi:hypothetical protein
MRSDLITFVAAEGRSDCLRQVRPSGVSSAQIVEVGDGFQLIATLHGSRGTWKMSSPGGLVDTMSTSMLFERFIEAVLSHVGQKQLLAA